MINKRFLKFRNADQFSNLKALGRYYDVSVAMVTTLADAEASWLYARGLSSDVMA